MGSLLSAGWMGVVVRLAGVDGGVVGVGEAALLCLRLLGLTIRWSGSILPSEAGLAGWDPLWTTSFLYDTSPLYGVLLGGDQTTNVQGSPCLVR